MDCDLIYAFRSLENNKLPSQQTVHANLTLCLIIWHHNNLRLAAPSSHNIFCAHWHTHEHTLRRADTSTHTDAHVAASGLIRKYPFTHATPIISRVLRANYALALLIITITCMQVCVCVCACVPLTLCVCVLEWVWECSLRCVVIYCIRVPDFTNVMRHTPPQQSQRLARPLLEPPAPPAHPPSTPHAYAKFRIFCLPTIWVRHCTKYGQKREIERDSDSVCSEHKYSAQSHISFCVLCAFHSKVAWTYVSELFDLRLRLECNLSGVWRGRRRWWAYSNLPSINSSASVATMNICNFISCKACQIVQVFHTCISLTYGSPRGIQWGGSSCYCSLVL